MLHEVSLHQLDGIPLAVVRRQAQPSDLSRLVPECCGLVWNVCRTQQAKAGRHVAIYWDATIRLEAGVELLGPFSESGRRPPVTIPGWAVESAPSRSTSR